MKSILRSISAQLSKISVVSGQLVAWMVLFMVVVMSLNVLSSWLFNSSSILLSETITWMHSANFLLAAAYTLNRQEHVRVDIFYSRMSVSAKALVDLLGTLFLLIPVCIFIFWSSWSYVILSWRLGEVSAEAGGMPALFLLKAMLLLMPALLIIEGLNQLCLNILKLTDRPSSDKTIEGAK